MLGAHEYGWNLQLVQVAYGTVSSLEGFELIIALYLVHVSVDLVEGFGADAG